MYESCTQRIRNLCLHTCRLLPDPRAVSAACCTCRPNIQGASGSTSDSKARQGLLSAANVGPNMYNISRRAQGVKERAYAYKLSHVRIRVNFCKPSTGHARADRILDTYSSQYAGKPHRPGCTAVGTKCRMFEFDVLVAQIGDWSLRSCTIEVPKINTTTKSNIKID